MHTPTPWKRGPELTIVDENGGRIALLSSTRGKFEWEASNLDHIVRAVNSYQTMLDTLEWLDSIGGLGLSVHERIRRTIAEAKK